MTPRKSPGSAAPQAADVPDRLDRRLVMLALTTLVGGFATLLDSTIVSVAINSLGNQFGSPLSTIQWVITGYLLALTMVIPLTGWAIERFGARPMWVASLALFLAGSALCGFAWSATSLIVFRVVQGFGGGMILPIAQTIVVQAAGPRRIGRVMSMIAIPAQLSPILGPVVGGLIVDSLSWRWLFFINVPIVLAAMIMSIFYIPAGAHAESKKLDVLGLVLLSPALATLVYGLSLAGHNGFGDSGALTWLIIGAVLLVAYIVHSLRPRIHAIIDVRLFRSRSFTAASMLQFLFGVSMFAAMFLLPLYYTQARGQSALAAGLLLAPQGAGTLIALSLVGKLTDRINPRPIILVGMLVASIGTIPYVFVGQSGNEFLLGAALLVRGMGLGAAVIPLSAAAYQGLGKADVPRATSAVNIIQRIGSSFGTAVLAVVLEQRIAVHGATGAGKALAFGDTFVWTLVLTGAALIPALLLPGRPEPDPAEPAPRPAEEDTADARSR
ncbi:DHA2 family efflux MFS transporter permease subunit [Amycolatopsis sp. NPDC049688]|uniref:DHA2 family efflux MFS transporter permease subunit n=1 Tax=Amycolatopsis sp. NPDC049688 TaxID=3154733 RepID=UPI0034124890